MGSIDQALRHRLTVADYHRMGEAGVLAPDARVELIEGELIDMAPIGSRHSGTVNHLTHLLVQAVAGRAVVQVQNPVRLGLHSEPRPDIALLRPRPDYYRDETAGAADVLLIVEVADSSLDFDRAAKIPLYASHDVPEVWLVDLPNRLLTIHRLPSAGIYRSVQTTGAIGLTEIALLPGVVVDLEGIF